MDMKKKDETLSRKKRKDSNFNVRLDSNTRQKFKTLAAMKNMKQSNYFRYLLSKEIVGKYSETTLLGTRLDSIKQDIDRLQTTVEELTHFFEDFIFNYFSYNRMPYREPDEKTRTEIIQRGERRYESFLRHHIANTRNNHSPFLYRVFSSLIVEDEPEDKKPKPTA